MTSTGSDTKSVRKHIKGLKGKFSIKYVKKNGELREGVFDGPVFYPGYLKARDVELDEPRTLLLNRIVKVNSIEYMRIWEGQSLHPLKFYKDGYQYERVGMLFVGVPVMFDKPTKGPHWSIAALTPTADGEMVYCKKYTKDLKEVIGDFLTAEQLYIVKCKT